MLVSVWVSPGFGGCPLALLLLQTLQHHRCHSRAERVLPPIFTEVLCEIYRRTDGSCSTAFTWRWRRRIVG